MGSDFGLHPFSRCKERTTVTEQEEEQMLAHARRDFAGDPAYRKPKETTKMTEKQKDIHCAMLVDLSEYAMLSCNSTT